MKNYNFEFQKKFAAVYLPRSQSLCFYNTNYATLPRHYVVWLEQNTAKALCKRDLSSISGHYRFDDDVSLHRIHASPCSRLPLPYVAYWNGELRFTNGRHRTRTLIDFGAEYIPFDIEEVSLKEMAQDGIRLDHFEKAQDFSDRVASMTRYAKWGVDPVINTHKMAFPRQMSMDAVIKASQLHLKLLNFDIKAITQLKDVLVALNRHKALKRHNEEAYIHNEIFWYRDALRIALPAFVSLKRQGIMQWPNGTCFPAYIGGPPNGMMPEEAVKDWTQRLPVPVRLGHPINGRKPNDKVLGYRR